MWTPWSIRRECREAQSLCMEAIASINRSLRTAEDLFSMNRDLSAQNAALRADLAAFELVPVASIGEDMQRAEIARYELRHGDIPHSDDSFLKGIGITPLWRP